MAIFVYMVRDKLPDFVIKTYNPEDFYEKLVL